MVHVSLFYMNQVLSEEAVDLAFESMLLSKHRLVLLLFLYCSSFITHLVITPYNTHHYNMNLDITQL